MNLEYDNGINTPSNISLVKARTAEKTQTPDSNYSSRKVTIPRYLGSKLQSVNYNFYTPVSSSASFLDGTSGSWSGDISYGKTPVIDKNPIYFAHFKSSKENYELWDSYTFRLDALIQVPFEDVRGTEFNPATLKVDGSNDKLAEVISTFEKDRGAIVAYSRGQFNKVDYTSLRVGDNTIFQGGLEYNLVIGNETGKTTYLPTSSFITASWGFGQNKDFAFKGDVIDGTYISPKGKDYALSTGSGYFLLEGGYYRVSSSYENGQNVKVWQGGPGLGLLHTLNVATSMSQQMFFNTGSSAIGQLGIPRSGSQVKYLNPRFDANYFNFSPTSGSSMTSYEDFSLPFIIKRGDEIRVTYNAAPAVSLTASIPQYETVDFTVTAVAPMIEGSFATTTDYEAQTQKGSIAPVLHSSIVQNTIWNKLKVTPDPSTIDIPIPKGEVYQFTIRRRVEADDRVIVFQTPPSGSKGFKTISGQGYLIPNDLTPTQKRNVQTMIGQLNSKNLFLDTADVEATSSI